MFHKVSKNYSSMKKQVNDKKKENEIVKLGEGLKNININNNKPLENKNFISNNSTVRKTIKLKI